jgi:hypothetical protein
MLKEILSFSKGILTDPQTQLRKIFNGEVKASVPAAIYILCACAEALFLSVKPPDFPAEFAQLGLKEKSCAFYFTAGIFWDAVLTAVSSTLLLYFLKVFRAGKVFFKIISWALVFIVCAGTAVYAEKAWPVFYAKTPVVLLLTAGMLFFIAGIIRRERTLYWRFLQAALVLNLAGAVVLPLEFAAVYLNSENLFLIAEIITGLWTLVLFTKTARIFTETSVPRTIISLGAGCLAALSFLFLLHKGGVISEDTYNILLTNL